MRGQVLQAFALLAKIGFQPGSKFDIFDARLGNDQSNVQRIRTVWFSDIVIGAGLENLFEISFPIAGGPDENQMSLSFRLAADPLTKRKSVHARQKQIEEQQRIECQAVSLDRLF